VVDSQWNKAIVLSSFVNAEPGTVILLELCVYLLLFDNLISSMVLVPEFVPSPACLLPKNKLVVALMLRETNLGNPGTSFHHIAMQYDGTGSFHLWLDGTHKISASHSISATTNLFFGNRQAGEGTNSGTNTIDEIRLSNNNRYTHSSSNITVPGSAFTNDDNTIALFHCESTTQTDDNS
jgi:hypothetical protein